MGKKVIITGSRGIAAGLARALNQRNYEIYLLGGEEADSASLAKECSNVTGFNSIDLRNEEQVESAFVQAVAKLNGLDHVVSIVGGSGRSFGDGGIEEITKAAWDKTLELNLTTAFLTAREAIKYFNANGPGSLTLTSSTLANSPSPEHFKTHAYAASKGAINTLVITLASSYLDKKIRVNAVSPSLVATPMSARAAENPIIKEFTSRKQPLIGEQLPIDNVVAGYIYLIENSAVTGQILEIDGGWSTVSGV
jgi:NAD(P)-dependent dehydrogenase (short-subunit alcohol dehydrogenase family)